MSSNDLIGAGCALTILVWLGIPFLIFFIAMIWALADLF